jgi:hypothetical protein
MSRTRCRTNEASARWSGLDNCWLDAVLFAKLNSSADWPERAHFAFGLARRSADGSDSVTFHI